MKIAHKSLLLAYTKNGEIILQDRSNIDKIPKMEIGYWGGGIEINETKEEAIIREIKEELNLTIENKQLYFFGQYKDIYE
jgi:ADP-ribose pyrophosphatase YjhB (NUDIX family)